MLLPQTVEYAFRAMACLAMQPPGATLRASDLAKKAHIPPAYLSKVMRRLVTAGLIESQKGHGGGFTLTRPPAEVSFVEILQAMGFAPDDQRCVFGWATCDGLKPCPLHETWSSLKSSFLSWAERTTLAQVGRDGWVERAAEPPVSPKR